MFDCRTDSNQKTGFSIRVDYVDSDCPIKNYVLSFCTCLVLFWNDFSCKTITFHHCILVFLGQSLRRTRVTKKNHAIYPPNILNKTKTITHRKGCYVNLCKQKLLFKIQKKFQHMILFAWKQNSIQHIALHHLISLVNTRKRMSTFLETFDSTLPPFLTLTWFKCLWLEPIWPYTRWAAWRKTSEKTNNWESANAAHAINMDTTHCQPPANKNTSSIKHVWFRCKLTRKC